MGCDICCDISSNPLSRKWFKLNKIVNYKVCVVDKIVVESSKNITFIESSEKYYILPHLCHAEIYK